MKTYGLRSGALLAAFSMMVAESSAPVYSDETDSLKPAVEIKPAAESAPAVEIKPAAESAPAVEEEPEHPAMASVRTARQMMAGGQSFEYARNWLFRNRPESFDTETDAGDAIEDATLI
jgi:hypothetical protein